ncbi:MAG: TfoX/Sxy family protein [Candidatus Promineifilaceae bacterium]|nr:TfoX/Sxy family protein [Candidatus Promineifilaceae bacterium]
MAYDEGLLHRMRALLDEGPEVEEKKMFGGVGFMLQGNMACGILNDDLIVRVGPDRYEEALAAPHARPFDITGRPMTGWVMVGPAGYGEDEDLERWVQQGLTFAESLPAK